MYSTQYGLSITQTCSLMGLTRQSYYRHLRREQEQRELARKVVALVESIRLCQPRIGTRKLYHLLEEQLKALSVGRDKLLALLQANKMLVLRERSYHITTDSHHRFRKHKNLIEHLAIKRAEQVWVADITYIGIRERPLYLFLVTDAWSKKVMGWSVSDSLATVGGLDALEMAYKSRSYPNRALIHHSDRGLQYCSDAYQEMLTKYKIGCSMTESYDPYQNAVAERINGILKQEFLPRGSQIYQQWMTTLVRQSIDIYNKQRPHWSLYLKTPDEVHRKENVTVRTYKKEKSGNPKTT